MFNTQEPGQVMHVTVSVKNRIQSAFAHIVFQWNIRKKSLRAVADAEFQRIPPQSQEHICN